MGWTMSPSAPDDRPPGKDLPAPQHTPQDYLDKSIVPGKLAPNAGQQGTLITTPFSTALPAPKGR